MLLRRYCEIKKIINNINYYNYSSIINIDKKLETIGYNSLNEREYLEEYIGDIDVMMVNKRNNIRKLWKNDIKNHIKYNSNGWVENSDIRKDAGKVIKTYFLENKNRKVNNFKIMNRYSVISEERAIATPLEKETIKDINRKLNFHEVMNYNKKIEKAVEKNNVKKAQILFNEMKRDGVEPDNNTYSILLELSKRGNLILAEKYMSLMLEDENVRPSIENYLKVIKIFIKAKDKTRSDYYLYLMEEDENCEINENTYTEIIETCIHSNNIKNAVHFFNKMLKLPNFEKNILSFTRIIRALIEKRFFEDADKCYEYLLNGDDPVIPTVDFYNNIINSCIKRNEYKRARMYLQDMNKYNLKPDKVTYSNIIKIFVDMGEIEKAESIFNKNLEQRSIYSVTTMFHAYVNCENVTKAEEFFVFMLKENFLNEIHFNSIINLSFKLNDSDKAEEYFRLMAENNIHPSQNIYNTMIISCIKLHKTELAEQYFELFKNDIFVKPTISTYNAIILAFVKNRDVSKAKHYVDIMSNDSKVKLNGSTFYSLFSLCSLTKNPKDITAYYSLMCKYLISPNSKIYSQLISSCILSDDIKLADNFFFRMVNNPYFRNQSKSYHLHKIISTCLELDLPELAEKYFHTFIKKKSIPGFLNYDLLISYFLKNKDKSKAHMYYNSLKKNIDPSEYEDSYYNDIFSDSEMYDSSSINNNDQDSYDYHDNDEY